MITGALQQLSRHLRAPGWLLRRQPQLGAFHLPTEITYMISEHLTNTSLICLALTCRTLYTICFPRSPHLDATETKELLLWLEKDISSLYFCHFCSKLHKWHRRWSKNIPYGSWDREELPCVEKIQCSSIRFTSSCIIPYHIARLIMNRHFYGPSHGIPVYKIEGCSLGSGITSKVKKSNSLKARIIDDKLLILSVRTATHSEGHSRVLREHIDILGRPVCCHLTLAKGYPVLAPVQLPELAKDKTAPKFFAPCNQSFGSCAFCLTDYAIDISWCGKAEGYAITVQIYQQIGDCRSPFDWSWTSMSSYGMKEEARSAYPLEYRPGIIRDMWNKANGVDSKTQSQWVGIPGLDKRRAIMA